jgi:hypothetical protein
VYNGTDLATILAQGRKNVMLTANNPNISILKAFTGAEHAAMYRLWDAAAITCSHLSPVW